MDMSFEEMVRERAYHIWLAGGMADGQAHEHWAQAEQAVKGAEPVVILTKAAKKPAAKAAKPAAKASKPVAKTAKSAAKPAAAKKAAKVEMTAAH